MLPKFEKQGLKDLELPIAPIPEDPCLRQGCTGPLGDGASPPHQPWDGDTGPNSSGQAGGLAWSVLGQVGRPALSLPREGFEALGCCLVCWWRWGLRRGLHVGEGGGAAIAGRSPYRGLQHLHGVSPLAARAGDCIERCAGARQCAGQCRRVLPGCFGWPRFGFVILIHVFHCGKKRR